MGTLLVLVSVVTITTAKKKSAEPVTTSTAAHVIENAGKQSA